MKPGPFVVGARISVILINFVVGDAVLFCVSGQYLDLVGDAVAVALVLIIAGKAEIERHPFLHNAFDESRHHFRPLFWLFS